MAEPKSLPIDHRWKQDLGVRDHAHEFRGGEYVAVPSTTTVYPRAKYHRDYVHDKQIGVEYPFTACMQVVENETQEKALGDGWANSPAEHGIVTEPDAEHIGQQKRQQAAAGSNWRAAAALPTVSITDHHLAFLKSQGMQIDTLGQVYTFLAGLTSAQMKSFMEEAAAWVPDEVTKRGPGRPPRAEIA